MTESAHRGYSELPGPIHYNSEARHLLLSITLPEGVEPPDPADLSIGCRTADDTITEWHGKAVRDQLSRISTDPELNIVLDGGPFDGTQLSGNASQSLAIGKGTGSPYFVYRPTGEPDGEFPNLMRYVPDIDGPA